MLYKKHQYELSLLYFIEMKSIRSNNKEEELYLGYGREYKFSNVRCSLKGQ